MDTLDLDDDPRLVRDRAAAQKWARGLLPPHEHLIRDDWVILDSETTGLYDAEICDLAVISKEGEALLDSRVKPSCRIPAEATRIHGITDEMVKDAPTLDDLIPRLEEILHGKLVVVYNAPFDRGILADCLLRRWRRPWPTHEDGQNIAYPTPDAPDSDRVFRWLDYCTWECAMEQYARYVGEWNEWHGNYRWQRLPAAPGVKAHTALGDCQSTLALIKRMAEGG